MDASQGGVRLIAHNEPEFDNRIAEHYPLIANAERYQRASKFLAILQHDGAATAKAYCVPWNLQQSAGRQRTMRALYVHKHAMARNAERVIEPGTERLISPFFNLSRSDYRFHSENATLRIPSHFPFLDAEVLSVSLDAVIHSTDPASAWIFGPDVYDLRSKYMLCAMPNTIREYRSFVTCIDLPTMAGRIFK